MTTWMVRKTGSDTNGGTSQSVRSSGTDGITSAAGGSTKITSPTGNWTAADIGHGIYDSTLNKVRVITAVQAQQTVTGVTTSSGSANITSAGGFTAGMVGCAVVHANIPAGRWITVVTDASHATLNSGGSVTPGTANMTVGSLATTSGTTDFGGGNNTGITWSVGGPVLTVNNVIGSAVAGNGVAAGDSVYIGAGVYRETIAVSVSGSAGLPISVIGDVDGAVTGDPGEVRITNYLVDDKTVASPTNLFALGTNIFLSFSLISFVSGSNVNVIVGTAGAHDITFTDCVVVQVGTSAAVTMPSPTTGIACSFTFDRCVVCVLSTAVCMTLTLATTASGAGDWDANIAVRNSLFLSGGTSSMIQYASSGANVHRGGGLRVSGCTFLGGGIGVQGASLANSTSIPAEVHGCLFVCPTGVSSSGAGSVVEDHNLFYCGNARSGVPVGPASISNNSYAPLFDIGQAFKVSGIARPFLSPSSPTSPLLAFGQSLQNTGGPPGAFLDQRGQEIPGTPGWRPPGLLIPAIQSPLGGQVALQTVDWANRPRPAGTQSNLPTVGYMEYHDSATKDTVTYDVTPASAKLVGPGDIDLLIPVDAGSQTISVKCNISTAYPSNQPAPSLTLLSNGEIGVTAQTVSADITQRGAWQSITLAAINPTASGILKLRLTSFDNSGTAQVNFDTVAVA